MCACWGVLGGDHGVYGRERRARQDGSFCVRKPER